VNYAYSMSYFFSNSQSSFRPFSIAPPPLQDVTNSRSNLNGSKPDKGLVQKKQHNQINVAPRQSHTQSSFTLHPPTNALPFQRQTSIDTRGSGYQYTGRVDNIDERDANDPLCATDYVQDMYQNFRMKEVTTSVRPVYMESQPHINERMRSILVDWLVEVHLKFKLVPETLYLTINVIDRYLDRSTVTRPKLQLVGVTALLIASKYEEIYPPELRDLVYICDHAYRKEQILQMEETILKCLEYKITIPSAHAFLVRYLKAAHADRKIVQLSCYILDGTLQSYNLLHYLPSQLAAAAVLIARKTVGRNAWSPTLLKYASYREEDIIPVAKAVLAEKKSASTELRAVNKKYSSQRYGSVASTPLDDDFELENFGAENYGFVYDNQAFG
jgi:Cyclin